jgi:hypothetical protein
MSPKHTAGPWTACTNHAWGKLADIRTESGDAIAFCQTLIESDARLIAAAPELLTHLSRVVSQFNALENNLSEADILVIGEAKAAIAKAIGKTP